MNNEQIEKIWKAFWALPETKRNQISMTMLGITFGWMSEEHATKPANRPAVEMWFTHMETEVSHD